MTILECFWGYHHFRKLPCTVLKKTRTFSVLTWSEWKQVQVSRASHPPQGLQRSFLPPRGWIWEAKLTGEQTKWSKLRDLWTFGWLLKKQTNGQMVSDCLVSNCLTQVFCTVCLLFLVDFRLHSFRNFAKVHFWPTHLISQTSKVMRIPRNSWSGPGTLNNH